MAVPDFVELFSPAPSPFLMPPMRGGLDFKQPGGGGGEYGELGFGGDRGGEGGGGEFDELPGIEYPGAG